MSTAEKANSRVHVINFFEPKPQAIRCLAYDSSVSRLAVTRADSSIEIWDTRGKPYLELTIPGSSDASEIVSAVAWCQGRLFSAGISGYIVEHDFTTLLPKYEVLASSGCPIRCMKFNCKKNCLAIGNDDGHVVLFDLVPDYLDFQKKLDKQEGGIICLDWHKNDYEIVTGSMDVIRIWDVGSGHVVNRIILSRAVKDTPTIVWCISFTRDYSIISGDSCGKVSFWNANSCTLLSSFTHSADVLTLCLNQEQDTLYVSGVDTNITTYRKSGSSGKWMKSITRYIHTHDVHTLQFVGDYLVSGGDDCRLVFSKYPPKTNHRYFPFSQKSFCEVAEKAQCVLLNYLNYLEVWRIGSSTSPLGSSTTPVNLLQIRAKDGESMVCCSLSSDCKWLAYSNQFKLRLFNLQLEEDPMALKILSKVTLPTNIPNTARIILFSNSTPAKMIFYCKRKIYILKCDTEAVELIATLYEDPDCEEEVHLMDLSCDDMYLACGSRNGKVVVFSLETNKVFCYLPVYKHQPTALKFDSNAENLIVVYSDRKVIEYSIAKKAYTSWCKQHMLLNFQSESFYPVTSIACCSNKLIFNDENSLYLFDKTEQLQPFQKRLKTSENERSENEHKQTFKTITKYEHISCVHSYNNEVVLLQIPATILEVLPPPIWKKKYGT